LLNHCPINPLPDLPYPSSTTGSSRPRDSDPRARVRSLIQVTPFRSGCCPSTNLPLLGRMADRNRDYDDTQGSLDPELLYTKEFCIGWSYLMPQRYRTLLTGGTQAGAALVKSTRGPLPSSTSRLQLT